MSVCRLCQAVERVFLEIVRLCTATNRACPSRPEPARYRCRRAYECKQWLVRSCAAPEDVVQATGSCSSASVSRPSSGLRRAARREGSLTSALTASQTCCSRPFARTSRPHWCLGPGGLQVLYRTFFLRHTWLISPWIGQPQIPHSVIPVRMYVAHVRPANSRPANACPAPGRRQPSALRLCPGCECELRRQPLRRCGPQHAQTARRRG